MRTKIVIVVVIVVAIAALSYLFFRGGGSSAKMNINGAGATFPYPVYSKWAYQYEGLSGTKVNYQSIGSGGGIAQIKAKTVDFGASDAPLKSEELKETGLLQFPMVIGGVVPVVNLTAVGSGELKLSAELLADIYLGRITRWNDVAIASLNPGISLPDKAISVVHRADGSGTTWIFTDYLSKVSDAWRSDVGVGKAVSWPVGLGGKGNEGVAAYVKRVDGAIGYVEYAYALQNDMKSVKLQNKSGEFVDPTALSFQAAAANADWAGAPGFYMVLTDQPGTGSWPITGASFILVYEQQTDALKAKRMLSYFDWCFRHGGALAEELHYVPMPMGVVDLIEKIWSERIRHGEAAIWPPK